MADSQPSDNNDSFWTSWRVISAAAVVILALVALVVIKPAMPDRIALLTGPEGTAYYELGQRYAADLRRRGLDAEVVATAGPLENIQRVAQGETAVAFAPSTTDWKSDADVDVSHLAALGSVGYEPLWLFCRSDLDVSRVADLAGKTVLTEGPGTASHHVAEVLLEKNGIAGQVQLVDATGDETPAVIIDKFTSGAVDALFITGGADSTRGADDARRRRRAADVIRSRGGVRGADSRHRRGGGSRGCVRPGTQHTRARDQAAGQHHVFGCRRAPASGGGADGADRGGEFSPAAIAVCQHGVVSQQRARDAAFGLGGAAVLQPGRSGPGEVFFLIR